MCWRGKGRESDKNKAGQDYPAVGDSCASSVPGRALMHMRNANEKIDTLYYLG